MVCRRPNGFDRAKGGGGKRTGTGAGGLFVCLCGCVFVCRPPRAKSLKSLFDFYRVFWVPLGEMLTEMEHNGVKAIDRIHTARTPSLAQYPQYPQCPQHPP